MLCNHWTSLFYAHTQKSPQTSAKLEVAIRGDMMFPLGIKSQYGSSHWLTKKWPKLQAQSKTCENKFIGLHQISTLTFHQSQPFPTKGKWNWHKCLNKSYRLEHTEYGYEMMRMMTTIKTYSAFGHWYFTWYLECTWRHSCTPHGHLDTKTQNSIETFINRATSKVSHPWAI